MRRACGVGETQSVCRFIPQEHGTRGLACSGRSTLMEHPVGFGILSNSNLCNQRAQIASVWQLLQPKVGYDAG
jgi:hypothetical protein